MKSLFFFWIFLAATATAETQFPLSIRGRSEVVVTTSDIFIGDVAEITALPAMGEDETVGRLQKLVLAPSPSPGAKTTIAAGTVIERINRAGIDIKKIGYTFPQIINISRAGREISKEEIRLALNQALRVTLPDAEVRSVDLGETHTIYPGDVRFSLESLSPPFNGISNVALKVTNAEGESMSLTARAKIDQFQALPVARRRLQRGEVVAEEDLIMARLNTNGLQRTQAASQGAIVGQEVTKAINPGEVFSRDSLKTPPIIEAGRSVVMRYKAELFEATATGIALDSGAQGAEIRVRNEQSKKILHGRVVEPGIVEVNQ